jgi:hypothetical protein
MNQRDTYPLSSNHRPSTNGGVFGSKYPILSTAYTSFRTLRNALPSSTLKRKREVATPTPAVQATPTPAVQEPIFEDKLAFCCYRCRCHPSEASIVSKTNF